MSWWQQYQSCHWPNFNPTFGGLDLFGPTLFWPTISLVPIFFSTKKCWDPLSFGTKIRFGPNFFRHDFLGPNFFYSKFGSQNFFDPKAFLDKISFNRNHLLNKLFGVQNSLGPKIYFDNNLLGPLILFWDQLPYLST